MKANELMNRRCEGLNGELGTIVKAIDPQSGTQGTGTDCYVEWDVVEVEDSWVDAGDVELI